MIKIYKNISKNNFLISIQPKFIAIYETLQ